MSTKDIAIQPVEVSTPRDGGSDGQTDWDRAVDSAEVDLLDLVRERLDLADEISDMTIASSLAAIAAQTEQRDRWLAAFNSPLGKRLAVRGGNSNEALVVLIALAQSRVS